MVRGQDHWQNRGQRTIDYEGGITAAGKISQRTIDHSTGQDMLDPVGKGGMGTTTQCVTWRAPQSIKQEVIYRGERQP